MGWVEEKLKDRKTTEKSVGPLWNSIRDSIGESVTEFQSRVHFPVVKWNNCKARGLSCMRVEKEDSFIEVFLSEDDQTICSAVGMEDSIAVASYRLNATRSGLELYRIDGEIAVVMTPDEVAQRALEDFLFTPFPTAIVQG